MFKNNTFHLLRFAFVFLVVSFAFYSYIGIISPGGKMYSRFLENYANLPAWFTYLICQGAKGLLQAGGYEVYQRGWNNITIRGSRGVNIIWACLGFRVMSFWAAFIVAHVANWKYKLKWILVGISLITSINIIRIALIALANHLNWKAFKAVEPHLAFNLVSYIAIFLLMFWFIKKYKKHRIENQKGDTKKKKVLLLPYITKY